MDLINFFDNIHIVQIGCGGTGSWVVPLVSKLANNIKLRLPENHKIYYNLIDEDIIESRNILRQNFNEWDIEKNKAHALVNKYIYNFPEIQAFPIKIKSKNYLTPFLTNPNEETTDSKNLRIVIGCVDNNQTRHIIYNRLKSIQINNLKNGFIYIDSGNLLNSGQIITIAFGFDEYMSNILDKNKLELFRKQIKKSKAMKFTKKFPKNAETEIKEQSCAFFGDQSQAINNLAATLIFCNVQNILINSELPPDVISFNSSGYSTFNI